MAVAGVFRLPVLGEFALVAAQAFEGIDGASEFKDEVGELFLQKALFVNAHIGERRHAQVEKFHSLFLKVQEEI